jgi:DNA-binding transcriptional MerR regulator
MKEKEQLLSVGRFAQLAGVTIRTLRYYDQKGLLKPSAHRESGYRLYSLNDLVKLEQIVTLKFIGLSLEEIGDILQNGEPDLQRILVLQQQIVDEKIRNLTAVARALQKAGESLRKNREVDWNDFIHIIRAVKMENVKKWTDQFYSDELRQKIEQRAASMTEEEMLDSQKQWHDLIEEVRLHLNDDPASPEVQQLAERWQRLIEAFTQGNLGIQKGLNNMYSNMESAPAEFREYHNRNKDVYAFMGKALAIRGEGC